MNGWTSYWVPTFNCHLTVVLFIAVPRMAWKTSSFMVYLLYSLSASLASSCTSMLQSCSTSSSWTNPVNACIQGHDEVVTYRIEDISACQTLCEQQTEFFCMSIEFKDGECHQSAFGQFTRSNIYRQPCDVDGWQYSERLQESDTCRNVWKTAVDASIRGHNDIIHLNVSSLDECKALCINEKRFPCRSVDFLDNGECYVSKSSWETVDSGTYTQPSYLETHRIIHAERADIGHWAKSVYGCIKGHDDRSFTNIRTEEECLKKCIFEESFLCLSVDFQEYKGQCRLSKSRRDTVVPRSDYQQPCQSDAGWKHRDRYWWS